MVQDAERTRVAAYHEAGHVIVAHVLGIDVHDVSIRPNKLHGYSGVSRFPYLMADAAAYKAERDELLWRRGIPPVQADELMREKVMDEAAMFMAGPVAQTAVTGEQLQDIWTGDADRTLIRLIASSPQEEQTLRKQATNRAGEILNRNRRIVEAVASGLLAHEELNSEQLKQILKGIEEHG